MTRNPILRSILPLLCLIAAPAAAQEPDAEKPRGPRSRHDSVTRTFYLENADVKDVATILRSVAGVPHLAADQSLAAIDVRGPADVVELAAKLVEAHDRRRSEVVVDVELIEIDSETLHDLGRQLGDSEGAKIPTRLSPSELERLRTAKDARVIAHPSLSAQAGRRAEVMSGRRVPITVDGAGTVTYQEVGFRLQVTPRVHPEAGEATLDFDLEISRRDDSSAASATPVIATQRITSSVRLKGGTTFLLAGLRHSAERPETEIALALTPRIRSGS